ncbi:MAG: hypothetical protein ACYDA4_16080 [Ignavibacteriaceae bacterium]
MKKSQILSISVLFSLFLLVTSTYSQVQGTVGKLYTKDQANQLFGPVLSSQTISASALLALVQKCPQYIMFNIINGQLFVLNANRSVLSGPTAAVSPTQVFHFCSSSMILSLLQTSGATTINVELRQNKLTITAGSQTLEDLMVCPPTCVN